MLFFKIISSIFIFSTLFSCNKDIVLNATEKARFISSGKVTLKNPTLPIDLNTTPEFTITNVENGVKIELFSDACFTKVAEGVVSGTSIDLTSSAITKGEYKFYIRETNSKGVSTCSAYTNYQIPGTPMITVWQTTTPNETITLPLRSGFHYNLLVDWGDGTDKSLITSFDDPEVTHTFVTSGTQTITISGTAEAWYFNNTGDKLKIYQVTELGDLNWKDFEGAFMGCTNLTTFNGGDTSEVKNMRDMFLQASSVTPDTLNWNISKVESMQGMFYQATNANPDTSNWDTSNVTNMEAMFYLATSANPDTSSWNTSKLTKMNYIFGYAANATPNTSNWDTSKVTEMQGVFFGATSATPDTSNWDTSSVTNMYQMFRGATNANPNTTNWDTSNVKSMDSMFTNAINANPNTTNWNTSKVTTMNNMFRNATIANPDVALWNVSSLVLSTRMFWSAVNANPDISNWNTVNLEEMYYMFYGATSANPDFSNLNFSKVTSMSNMLHASGISIVNYSNMLNQIVATSLQLNVILNAGSIQYNAAAAGARATLVTNGWTITDGGAE